MKKTAALVLLLACAAAAKAAPYGAGFYDDTEYLAGKVAVNIVFPESNGSAENWSQARKDLVVAKVQAAMSWWAARNSAANLSFVYVTRTVATPYEPITCNTVGDGSGPCPNGEEDWIKNVMGTIGYGEADYFDRVYHFNNDTRDANGTDWVFTVFVADSNNDADGMFADGYFAYAYVGGPFAVLTYDNENYGISNFDAVMAHETGHIFYALDEYAESGCSVSESAGYLNGTNQNCQNGGAALPCIMRGDTPPYNSPAVCVHTAKMLGWTDDDSNGKIDILDQPPTTALNAFAPDPTTNTTPGYTGTAHSTGVYTNSNPYTGWTPARIPNNIGINRVAAVEYRVDGGAWLAAAAADGSYNSNTEGFSFTAGPLGTAAHTIEARAKDIYGIYDATPASDPLTVNTGQAQDIPYVQDGAGSDADYTNSKNVYSANWGASYHSTGISYYSYAIGTTPGGNQVFGWQSVGASLSVTKTGLNLTEGTRYYFSVRAYPVTGSPSGIATSDGMTVDTTSPTARVIVTSPVPARTGAFSAKLIVNEANAVSGTPQLRFRTSSGLVVPLSMAFLVDSTWTATGSVESFHSTGTASLLFSGSDLAGNTGTSVTSGGSFQINYALTGGSSGTVSNTDGASVLLPAGSYSGTIFVSISTVAAAAVATADGASADSKKVFSSDLAREFTARDAAGTPVTTFPVPVTITLAYPDADNDGRVDVDLIKENTLWLYYLDAAAGKWTPVSGVRRDAAANTLSVEVPHFSVYSVRSAASSAGGIGALKAYPNPCDFRTTPALTIAGLPVDAEGTRVYIYNEAGELVRTLEAGDGVDGLNVITWDGRQDGGAKAASGIYIYLVKTSNYGKTTGKFFAIW